MSNAGIGSPQPYLEDNFAQKTLSASIQQLV
jgi:hypothetical protein